MCRDTLITIQRFGLIKMPELQGTSGSKYWGKYTPASFPEHAIHWFCSVTTLGPRNSYTF